MTWFNKLMYYCDKSFCRLPDEKSEENRCFRVNNVNHWQTERRDKIESDVHLTSSSCVLTSHRGIYCEGPPRLSLCQRHTRLKNEVVVVVNPLSGV